MPRLTRIGITSIGPPAPDSEHIEPVIIPKATIKSLLFNRILSSFLLSVFFFMSIDKPEQNTTKYKNNLAVSRGIIEFNFTPNIAPIKLPILIITPNFKFKLPLLLYLYEPIIPEVRNDTKLKANEVLKLSLTYPTKIIGSKNPAMPEIPTRIPTIIFIQS